MNNLSKPTIGIIGGMGPQASAKLLQILVELSTKNYGAKNDSDFPEIILNSIPVPDFISNKNATNRVLSLLREAVIRLEIFNPKCFAIACNTAHILLSELQSSTDVPFISIIEEVAREVEELGIKKVGLLATPVTIRSNLYQKALLKRNINVITPNLSQRTIIESVIRNVLSGKILNSDQKKLTLVSNSLRNKGAQGIILGCTELPLVFQKDNSFPVFDSIEILAEALLQKAYETRRI